MNTMHSTVSNTFSTFSAFSTHSPSSPTSTVEALPDLFITDSSGDLETVTWFEMICERARNIDKAELEEKQLSPS